MRVHAASFSRDELALRLHQQELVASFGLFALATPGGLQSILDEACRIAADGLNTQFAKALHYRQDTNDFLVVAGIGWHPGVVGHATLGAGLDSPAGYALHAGMAVLSQDLAHEQRFCTPPLLVEHGVRSAINVVIRPAIDRMFGVLEVDSTHANEFEAADDAFLQALANVLAAAIVRAEATAAQEGVLREKDLLMQEVHHRVKNSLQLVRTLLHLQSRMVGPEVREQLDIAAGRIQTIGAVHHRLYEGDSVGETDAAAYLRGLLDDMAAMLDTGSRTLDLDAEPMLLPADALSPLGLVTTELVTNAIKYGEGRVLVTLRRGDPGLLLTVEDRGTGFAEDFDPARPGGLGMRLVKAMAKGNPATSVTVDRSAGHGRVVVRLTL